MCISEIITIYVLNTIIKQNNVLIEQVNLQHVNLTKKVLMCHLMIRYKDWIDSQKLLHI